ncbi:hypothetical protein ACNO8X_26075 [Mycobacterium sp. PDNC021]|uniref:hypothetical protein n=1 Tax=Mycobacterium sp. PDNC021 TaxID=3391399 RepID=UPI003AAF1BBC
MKVRITKRPVGYISLDGHPLTAWPPAGQVVDLPDAVAEDLIKGGNAEKAHGPGRAWRWPWQIPEPEPVADVLVRIKVRPNGYVSIGGGPLIVWPNVGSVIELPAGVAEDLLEGGFAEVATDSKIGG